MLTGKGKIVIAKPEEDLLLVTPWSAFTFGKSSEFKEAMGWPFNGGSQQVQDSEVGAVTYTLKLAAQSIGELTLSHALDVKIANSSTALFPAAFQTTIPSGTPEIVVASLTANQQVQVSVANAAQPAFMKRVTTAPAASLEYQVAAGKIVFHSSDIGKLITYRYMKSFSNVRTMGVENASSYGYLEYSGILQGPLMPKDVSFYLGKIKAKGNVELSIADDVPTIEIEYSVATPDGWPQPWRVGMGIAV